MAKWKIDSISWKFLWIWNDSQRFNNDTNVQNIANSDSWAINNISWTPYNGSIEQLKVDSNANVLLNGIDIGLENSFKWELSIKTKEFLKEEFDKENNKMFTLFWVFASVVAFLLVEVQVLKTITSWQALMWISLIILWALTFFVLLIKVVLWLKDGFKCKENKVWIFVISILFLLSFWFIILWIYFAPGWDSISSSQEFMLEYKVNP